MADDDDIFVIAPEDAPSATGRKRLVKGSREGRAVEEPKPAIPPRPSLPHKQGAKRARESCDAQTGQGESNPPTASARVYLDKRRTYEDRVTIGKLGGKWDDDLGGWYVPTGVQIDKFRKWLPDAANAACSTPSSNATTTRHISTSAWESFLSR